MRLSEVAEFERFFEKGNPAYFMHLTGPTFSNGRVKSSFESLESILREGKIKGSGKEGFIRGSERAACFTAINLDNLEDLKRFIFTKSRNRPEQSYHGIVIQREYALKSGLTEVDYVPQNDIDSMPESEQWKAVRHEQGVNWTHEVEFRKKGSFSLSEDYGIIVKYIDERQYLRFCFERQDMNKYRYKPKFIMSFQEIFAQDSSMDWVFNGEKLIVYRDLENAYRILQTEGKQDRASFIARTPFYIQEMIALDPQRMMKILNTDAEGLEKLFDAMDKAYTGEE